MKKAIFAGLLVLTTAIIFAFTFKNADESEVKVSVTADKPTTFDLHMFSEGKILKGLTTPYEITVNKTDGKYILKSSESNSSLKMKVEKGNKQRLTAQWSIIVFVIDNDKLTTFGID